MASGETKMNYVDQFNDPAYGVMVRQLTQMPGLKDFVKEASLDDLARDSDQLPDSAFAWPEERRFPLHTDKHAALSYSYILAGKDVPTHVKEAAEQALDVYGVSLDLFKTNEKVASTANFLLPNDRLFPVNTAVQIKTAQAQFVNNLQKLNLERRVEAATNLVKVANEHGVVLDPIVQKTAGLTVCDERKLRSWLEARSEASKEPQIKLAYQTLANGCGTAELVDRDSLVKIAQTIAILDERAGLTKYYDRKLPDALQTVFNTEKTASACVDLCGKMVPITKLASLPASFWSDLGGAELANEIAPNGQVDASKLAAIVDTLPLDLKVVLKSQVR
jgi:hypothetical protein